MKAKEFREQLLGCIDSFKKALATPGGDWVVKGFIDVYRKIYTISVDTKVVSKIIELMLFPVISKFAADNGYKMVLSEHQNHYPDVTFIASNGTKFALDIKSTYRAGSKRVNGFTLGAFTGYFRNRHATKNITFPYHHYAGHFVIGIIYARSAEEVDERRVYTLDELQNIVSVIKDFAFLVHEKWRIASTRPGSGNTKNIGSVTEIEALLEGNGPFAPHGREVFDDYWMNYLTKDMARAIDSVVPYRNLKEYWCWRQSSP